VIREKKVFTGLFLLLAVLWVTGLEAASEKYVPDELIIKFSPEAAARLEEHLRQAGSPERLSISPELDELNKEYKLRLIRPIFRKFKRNRKLLQAAQAKPWKLLNRKQKHILTRLKRAPKNMKVPDLSRLYLLQFDLQPDQKLKDILNKYKASDAVEYAEFNYIISTCRKPNDPMFPLQWPLENTGQLYPESGKFNHPPGEPDSDIDAGWAWNFKTDANDIVVAVVDTGIDYTHRDIRNNMWVNEAELDGIEGVDDDENGYVDDIFGYDFINEDPDPMDDHGHGTHVAGIIAAEGDNGFDISGVCWKGQVMALKCLASNGKGDIAKAVECVYYAVENGADIMSNSWGGLLGFGGFPTALREAFDYAYSQGVISVASAGNQGSTMVNYPAIFENVISVTATDSNDELASFSNYGEYVDIAAPGVDVLSLRAGGTSRGTVYNDYLTIQSGTSMACPHVSAALALVLSYYPGIGIDDARDIIFHNADYMPGDICRWGRLNLGRAMAYIGNFYAGKVAFTSDVYSCDSKIQIVLNDLNLVGNGTQDVNVTTTAGDQETVVLFEEPDLPGVFSGLIQSDSGAPVINDGKVQLEDGQHLTVTYEDLDDGRGRSAIVSDTAVADCRPPVISNVRIDAEGPEPTVMFETDEPTTAFVLCELNCGGPYNIRQVGSTLAKEHTVVLRDLQPYTDYFFVIQAYDVAGNETIDSNDGNCYSFTTTGPADMYVPSQYPTIQAAIDLAWDSSTVWVADGTYTGTGNTDVDFRGRAIVVRSEGGPTRCIIDCNGSPSEPHTGFYFHSGEDANSILQGFTITNGYEEDGYYGGAVTCLGSSPTITNCIIIGNYAKFGGGISCERSDPTIVGCTITANASKLGGAIYCCSDAEPNILNCIITGNVAETGGALGARVAAPRLVNCTIVGNRATLAGGGLAVLSENLVVTNCIIWKNEAPLYPQLFPCAEPSYSCIQEWSGAGLGNISVDPCFVDGGYWDSNGTAVDTSDDIWFQGDYHLKSQGWRWSKKLGRWSWDDVTSRCIDAGNPGAGLVDEALTLEVDPLNRCGRNLRINMGAYGGTEWASIAPYGWILAADLTNDGKVDFFDLACWADYFLNAGQDLPADLNRDGKVDLADFALLGKDWGLKTSWHVP